MNKFKIVKSMLMNLPVSLTMSFVAQAVNIVHGHMAGFDWGGMAVSFLFSYFIAFMIAFFLPTDKWGFAFAKKCGANEGTWTFDVLVAKRLNIPYYDSQLLARAAEESGLSAKYLESLDEKNVMLSPLYQSIGFGTKDYVFLEQKAAQAQREIIEKIAAEGPCVIVGRRADQILQGKENLLSVFICGAEKSRIRHVSERDHISIKEAKQKVAKADRERSAYYNQTSDFRWGDPENYDVCINLDRIALENAADWLSDMAKNVDMPS